MKKALSIILALAMILALGACAKADEKPVEEVVPEADEKPVIAVVPKAVDNPLNQATKVGAERAGEELGFEVLWTGTPDTDSAGQVQVIESLIQKGVDGILMSANDPDALKDVINKAMEAGIPVATWDSDSAESNRLFYAGTDNYHLGYACGEKMVELAEGKEDFKVVVLHGTPGASNLETHSRKLWQTRKPPISRSCPSRPATMTTTTQLTSWSHTLLHIPMWMHGM